MYFEKTKFYENAWGQIGVTRSDPNRELTYQTPSLLSLGSEAFSHALRSSELKSSLNVPCGWPRCWLRNPSRTTRPFSTVASTTAARFAAFLL